MSSTTDTNPSPAKSEDLEEITRYLEKVEDKRAEKETTTDISETKDAPLPVDESEKAAETDDRIEDATMHYDSDKSDESIGDYLYEVTAIKGTKRKLPYLWTDETPLAKPETRGEVKTAQEALHIAQSAKNVCPVLSRVQPKDKEVYVFDDWDKYKKTQLYDNDGFNWKDNGNKPLKLGNSIIGKKIYTSTNLYKMVVTSELRKSIFLINEPKRAIVSYSGDMRVAVRNPDYNYHEHLKPPQQSKLPNLSQISTGGQFNEYLPIHETLARKYAAREKAKETETTMKEKDDISEAEETTTADKIASPLEVLEESEEEGVIEVEEKLSTETSHTPYVRTDTSAVSGLPEAYALSRTKSLKEKASPGLTMERDAAIGHRLEDIERIWEKAPEFLDANRFMISEPKGGECYFFDVSTLKTAWDRHVTKDGITWRNRHGDWTHLNTFYRRHDVYKQGEEVNVDFKRYCYYRADLKKVMIHYKGDESVVEHLPHGNAKTTMKPYIPKSAEVMERIASYADDVKPRKVYEKEAKLREKGLIGAVTTPGDKKMVSNYQYRLRKQTWENKDNPMAVLQAMNAFHGEWTVRGGSDINTPEFYVSTDKSILEYRSIQENLTKLGDPVVQILHYDTTFNVASMNCSIITAEHPFLTRAATGEQTGANYPIAAMFHERRTLKTHQKFITHTSLLFDIEDKRSILVVDREFKNIRPMPRQDLALCWNHLKENVARRASKKEGFTSNEDQQAVRASLHQLLVSKTEASFDERLRDFYDGEGHEVWTRPSFQNYFETSMKQDIKNYASQWYLERIGVPNPHLGITNNRAESFNAFMKGYTKQTVGNVPEAVHEMKCMLDSLDTEVEKAYYMTGELQLKKEFVNQLKRNPKNCPGSKAMTFEESKQAFREFLGVKQPLILPETPSKSGISETLVSRAATVVKDAVDIYERKDYTLIKEFNAWAVGNPRADILGRKEIVSFSTKTCTCGGRGMCCHYLAVMYASGARNSFYLTDQEIKGLPTGAPKVAEAKKYVSGKKTHSAGDLYDPAFHPPSAKKPKSATKTTVDVEMTKSSRKTPTIRKTGVKTPFKSPSTVKRLLFEEPDTDSLKTDLSTVEEKIDMSVRTKPPVAVGALKSAMKTPTIDKSAVETALKSPTSVKRSLSFKDSHTTTTKTDVSTHIEDMDTTERDISEFENITLDAEKTFQDIKQRTFNGRIKEQESRFLRQDGEIVAHIKNVTDDKTVGKMLITKVKGFKDDEKLKILAAELSNSIEYNQAAGTQKISVQISEVTKEQFFNHTSKLVESTTTTLKGRTSAVPVSCTCCQPKIPSPHLQSFDLNCSDCGEAYHKTCVSNPEAMAWRCSPCNISNTTKGMQWSEASKGKWINNTCTVDNFMTQAVVHSKVNKVDLKKFINNDEGEKAMMKSIEYAMKGESFAAQKNYHDYLVAKNNEVLKNKKYSKAVKMNEVIDKANAEIKKKNEKLKAEGKPLLKEREREKVPEIPVKLNRENDLFGSPDDLISKQLPKASTFYYEETCNNNKCANYNKPKKVDLDPTIYPIENNKDKTLGDIFGQTLTGTSKPCRTCKHGIQKRSELKFEGKKWFADFNLQEWIISKNSCLTHYVNFSSIS